MYLKVNLTLINIKSYKVKIIKINIDFVVLVKKKN
jgi:hypothetical protein